MRPLAAWLLLGSLLRGAPAADRDWAGPLRWVNAHPFHAVFLDTPPLDARIPRRAVFDLRLGHYNTLAMSPNVLTTPAGLALQANALAGLPQTSLDTASLAATAATRPAETFLFADTETTRLDLSWLQPLSDRWALAFEVPLYGHHGGVFDRTIEGFHKTFNFPDLNRSLTPANQTQLVVAHGTDQRVVSGPFEPAFGDLTARWMHLAQPDRSGQPAVLLSGSLKLPTGPASRFLGSGGWDWGLALAASKELGDFRLNATLGHNWHAGWRGLRSVPIRNTWDMHWGAECRFTPNWSILLQFSRLEHALQTASRETFGRPSYNVGLGFAYRSGDQLLLEGGFFENLTEDNNSYDVGLQYRMRWLP
ncbi:MAG: DUF3187 family protein [Fimbriimonadaceae bacterium]|nr:DUF3187 family protein [Fimbriimonadaceae bacterium]